MARSRTLRGTYYKIFKYNKSIFDSYYEAEMNLEEDERSAFGVDFGWIEVWRLKIVHHYLIKRGNIIKIPKFLHYRIFKLLVLFFKNIWISLNISTFIPKQIIKNTYNEINNWYKIKLLASKHQLQIMFEDEFNNTKVCSANDDQVNPIAT